MTAVHFIMFPMFIGALCGVYFCGTMLLTLMWESLSQYKNSPLLGPFGFMLPVIYIPICTIDVLWKRYVLGPNDSI